MKTNLVLCMLLIIYSASKAQNTKITDLKTEYLSNPIGIDAANPRFTWRMENPENGAKQTSYRILVSADSLQLLSGKNSIWDSGKIKSNEQLITYAGKPFQPFTKYYWTVYLEDQHHSKSQNQPVASFETGMMGKNWRGSWISDGTDINLKPAPYFRKAFNLPQKIKTARAYIAVAGLYELYINGEKIGNHRLDPMYTRYDRRTLYVTYDVTKNLQSGQNAIGVLLGNGWYNHQSTAVWEFDKAPWRNRPAFCLDLKIVYADGSTEIITSGKDWKTALSPIIFNSIYTAEHYDARLEIPGWNTANFTDSAWHNVVYRSAPSQNIVAQALQPIRNVEEIPTITLKKFSDTDYVFNLGRNIAGVSKITLNGAAGTIVKLRHTERLYANGHTDMSNIDIHYRPKDNTDPFQTDVIILSGKGAETFMPHFNYKGFQYVEVTSSAPISLDKNSLVGEFMHSDVEAVGQESSGNEILDKIWFATNNSYLSNFFGYPTDCPQREKNGWTGDAQIAIETGLYNFDGVTIYEKWLGDHRDEQQPNGVLPSIIPSNGWGYEWGNGPDWTSTIAIIPYNLYLFYGDKKPLADCYENIKRYVNHITEISPAGLTTWGLGDWVPVKSVSPIELTSSCYYYADANILAKAAKMFGKQADYEKYTALCINIKNAFNQKYLNPQTAIYADGFQTEMSAPLYWGLVPDHFKAKVAANLAKRVAADNFHLDVGLLGQKAILNALSENGYADVAYKIAAQTTYPSWGWWIVNGATTLYENWNIDSKADISLNHIMFGEISAWLYKGLGGIKPDSLSAGFKHIILKPHFAEGLDHFEAKHKSPFGWIVSSWKKVGRKVLYEVIVPPNSTATVTLPVVAGKRVFADGKLISGSAVNLDSGDYLLEWK